MAERESNGRFPKGVSGNPGGRPRRAGEIEAVLDEHRIPEKMREVLSKLRELALAGEPGTMKLYLDRVMGPVRDLDIDLSDAPDEVLAWMRDNLGVR